MRLRKRLLGIAPWLALAACATPIPSAPNAESTPLVRPPLPAGWQTVESDARDVRLALPPDFGVILTTPGVVAQPPAVGGIPVAEVQANPPQAVQPQPASGEPLGRWLEDSGLVPSAGQEGVTAVGDRTEREVQLPAGRSIEIAITADPGTEAASRVVVYAIASEDGIAVLRFVGQPGVVSSRAEDLRLIALLAEFGDLAADDRQASQLNP